MRVYFRNYDIIGTAWHVAEISYRKYSDMIHFYIYRWAHDNTWVTSAAYVTRTPLSSRRGFLA